MLTIKNQRSFVGLSSCCCLTRSDLHSDPQIQKGFVDALYDGGPFLHSLPAAIGKNGVLIAQVGEASELKSPPEHISLNRNRVNFIRTLSHLGFDVLRDYEEVRCVTVSRNMFPTFVPWMVAN